ncbi:type III pantothenate kinase [Alteromonas ponticola]|uniref:Type III pantothenate kinase n=1 Tax=Alteromonas aquimaris TaxID=2998417 RepID=A0ABT3PAI4_9ALTE|nr:type III pantothenate kinase [Alteromonas aquimaris]MCW8109715.1 type III pantothenate kinase [Alteromonas aquimaris]
MVTEQQVLLVDIGNTSVKFIPLSEFQNKPQSSPTLKTFQEWLALNPQITSIFLSSVRQAGDKQPLREFCKHKKIKLYEIYTEQKKFGLINSYQDVGKMGVDRWLAMIAAIHLTDRPFVVIDAGTAITVDFVADGQHLGGWIVPGFVTMKNALIASTQKVFSDDIMPDQLSLGTNTESGVAHGCLAAVQGIYVRARAHMAANYEHFDIFITGGDKNLFAFARNDGSILAANLVVQGLARYAKKQLFA